MDSEKEYIPINEFARLRGLTPEKAIEMIREGIFEGRINGDQWYAVSSEVTVPIESSQPDSKGIFSKLMDGDYGLAKTYWLFGVLGNLAFSIPIIISYMAPSLSTLSSMALVFIRVVSVLYHIVVLIGIWNASNKYQGYKLWAVLAKFAVILGVISVIVNILAFLESWK